MSEAQRTWEPTLDLSSGARRLLEASAGTGKTWQITHLVARLVAEYEIPIDRILVITFTKAATAELRARVRRRLDEARRALSRETPPEDPALRALHAVEPATRAARRDRLDAALSDFDRADISTIHGFCQRTLERFAFESDQAPGLEVAGDLAELREQIADDAMAATYAAAGEADLKILGRMKWSRATLASLVKLMTGPVEPTLEPTLTDDEVQRYTDPRAALADWSAQVDAFTAWLDGPDARAAIAALEQEASRTGTGVKRVPGFTKDGIGKVVAGLREWLAAGASLTDVKATKPTGPKQLAIRNIRARFKWKDSDAAWEDFPGRGLTDALERLIADMGRLWAAPLVAFARRARARFEAETDRRLELTYDAMLAHVADALAGDDARSAALREALRDRYHVALVDEFQDTDATQWTIIERVFGDRDRLFLIGDPKQSIYAFRHADLQVYRHAAATAETFDMTCNHRSDAPLVEGLGTIWSASPAPFGRESGVRFVPMTAAHPVRIEGLPRIADRDRCAVELRWLDAGVAGGDPGKSPTKEDARAMSYAACVDECRRLLASDAKIGEDKETIHAGHLAILVRTNEQAATLRAALHAEGIPAVTGGGGSIYASPAQGWLCSWLDAIARPQDERPARALAVSPLFDWSPAELTRALAAQKITVDPAGAVGPAGASEPSPEPPSRDWAAWRRDIAGWAKAWAASGFAAVFHRAMSAHGVYDRLLGSQVGERGATDLRHLAEICHAEERRAHLSPGALAEWLRRRKQSADDKAEEQSLRLESDARAVQISTIHSAKGLQYPIVLLPLAWEPRWTGDLPTFLRLYPATPSAAPPRYTLAPEGTSARERAEADYVRASHEESARLLYVAMTRAEHHLVAWQASYNESGPLTRLLLPDGLPAPKPTPGELKAVLDDAIAAIRAQTGGQHVGWSSQTPAPERPRYTPRGDPSVTIAVRTFHREHALGKGWQRPSYTSLSQSWHVEVGDALSELRPQAADPAWWAPCAGAALPGGIPTGDWLHKVMELVDFRDPGDPTALARLVAREGERYGVVDPAAHEEALRLLPRWLATPLDAPFPGAAPGLPDGFTLGDLGRADRVDELRFDLCLGAGADYARGGDFPPGRNGQVSADDARWIFEDALAHTRDGDGHGWRAWLERSLERPAVEGDANPDAPLRRLLPKVAGLLNGAIDLTFRIPTGDGEHRYFVVDYKSNAVRGPDVLRDARPPEVEEQRLPRLCYARPALTWEMGRRGYHLQSLVYSVALHRLLRIRLGEAHYDPDRHLGGHLYLFLKGMEGAGAGRVADAPLGVYADRWPTRTLRGLDAALSGLSRDEIEDRMKESLGD